MFLFTALFDAYDSRIRNERAALNFSWFRKMALGLLSKDTEKGSYKRKMLKNWAAPENLIKSILNKKEVNL